MKQRTQIGRYECWMEDGSIHMYSHEVGKAYGFSTKMTSEETMKLLEWLSQNHEEISLAVRADARERQYAH